MAVLAPMPSAIVNTITTAIAGFLIHVLKL
jgi:hypothetical protein